MTPTFRVPSNVLRADLEGKEVLLNPDTGVYHLVNATGRSLLEAFEAGTSFDEAVTDIAARSDVDPERVRRDAQVFVDDMLSRRLLERG
jgi:hypothetical protein